MDATPSDRVIVGLAAPFLRPVPWDSDGLRQFVPGAFARACRDRSHRVDLIVNHADSSPVIAHSGDGSLCLWESETGLQFMHAPLSRIGAHVCDLVQHGAFVGCSIAFYPHPNRSRWVSHADGVQSFTSVSLAEISLVPQGVAPRHPETWVRLMSPSDYHRLQATASIDVIMRHACTHFYGDQEVVLYQGVAYRLPAMLARVVVASGDASRAPYSPR